MLPEGTFGVTLMGPGRRRTCNVCRYWDLHGDPFGDHKSLRPVLERRLERVRGRYPYDALVGLSGGKDSAYVLYKLVVEHRLKVLAVTYDNGFLTDHARDNIARIVDALGVDHIFEEPDWEVHRSFYEGAFRRLGDPCLACAMSGYFLAIKVCHERQIPYFVHGRSPFQMFRNFHERTGDVFVPMIQLGIREHSPIQLLRLHRALDRHVHGWLDQLLDSPEQRARVYETFFLDPGRLDGIFVPESLAFFLYHPYDEEQIKQTIGQEVGYRRPEVDVPLGHGDCEIHDASAHLYHRLHGVRMVEPELAVMLRWKLITPERAQQILAHGDPTPASLERSVARFCERVGIDLADFHAIADDLQCQAVDRFASH
jgi:hypothetical protein